MAILPIDNLRALLEGKDGQWMPFSIDIGAIKGFSEPVQRQFEQIMAAFAEEAQALHKDIDRIAATRQAAVGIAVAPYPTGLP